MSMYVYIYTGFLCLYFDFYVSLFFPVQICLFVFMFLISLLFFRCLFVLGERKRVCFLVGNEVMKISEEVGEVRSEYIVWKKIVSIKERKKEKLVKTGSKALCTKQLQMLAEKHYYDLIIPCYTYLSRINIYSYCASIKILNGED